MMKSGGVERLVSTTWLVAGTILHKSPLVAEQLMARFQANLVAAIDARGGLVRRSGWADTTMLHAQAKHPVCAYKWMEWSLNKNLQSSLAEWFGSNPVVAEACKTKAPGGSDFCGSNGFDRFAQIRFWRTPVAKCATQGTCVPYSRWTTDYIAIMGGR